MKNTINNQFNNLLQLIKSITNDLNKFTLNKSGNYKEANVKEIFLHIGFFNDNEINEIESIIGCKINNIAIFEQAFIHRSFLNVLEKVAKNKQKNIFITENLKDIISKDWNIDFENLHLIKSNERLEFLGDSILGLLVAEFLFLENNQFLEGDLSINRSKFVNKDTLVSCCKELKLNKFIKINSSAKNSLNSGNESILSDLLEAIIAAIYLDSGINDAREFIRFKVLPFAINNFMNEKNYKSILMEHLQSIGKPHPIYKTMEAIGPDHLKEFKIGVFIEDEYICEGIGKSKKMAEQNGAKLALELLNVTI